jgi:hypothetical protein
MFNCLLLWCYIDSEVCRTKLYGLSHQVMKFHLEPDISDKDIIWISIISYQHYPAWDLLSEYRDTHHRSWTATRLRLRVRYVQVKYISISSLWQKFQVQYLHVLDSPRSFRGGVSILFAALILSAFLIYLLKRRLNSSKLFNLNKLLNKLDIFNFN